METKYTPEPWGAHYSESEITIGPSGENTGPDFAAMLPGIDRIQAANAARIVSCVDACAPIPDPEKAIPALVEALIMMITTAEVWVPKGQPVAWAEIQDARDALAMIEVEK